MENIPITPRGDLRSSNYRSLLVNTAPQNYLDTVHETVFPQLNISCYITIREICREYGNVLILSSFISKLIKSRFQIVIDTVENVDKVSIPDDFIILTCPSITKTFRVTTIIDRENSVPYILRELNINKDQHDKFISIGDPITDKRIDDLRELYKTRSMTISESGVDIKATLITMNELVTISNTGLHYLYGKN